MFKLTFTFKTIDELKEKFTAVLAGFGEQKIRVDSTTPELRAKMSSEDGSTAPVAEPEASVHIGATEKPAGKKRGRKPNAGKQTTAAPVSSEDTLEAEEAITPTASVESADIVEPAETIHAGASVVEAVTKKTVTEALQKLLDAGKLEYARNILKKFGATRIPELKEENYADIVKACDDVLA